MIKKYKVKKKVKNLKNKYTKKETPDIIYDSKIISSLINNVMCDGKKVLALKLVYSAMLIVKKKTKQNEIEIFTKAFTNLMPLLELRSCKIGGANYQVPFELTKKRQSILAIKWLVKYARKREEKSFSERLANEIIDASNNIGKAIKQKETVHKMAKANRAFAHYHW